jgi:uncharacterized SAM-binding protein YcdF (DUF218 family)
VLSIAASEWWHRTASRSGPGRDAPATTRSCAVVVLGFPSRRNGDPHALQRWRTQIGIRSLGSARTRRLVFTGGPSRGAQISEAKVMADHARRRGVPAEAILLEEEATSTWENLTLAAPLIEAFDTIVIASDPLHAARSRRYLVKQRPDLGARLVFADDYRPLERWWLKPPIAAYELGIVTRDRLRYGRSGHGAVGGSATRDATSATRTVLCGTSGHALGACTPPAGRGNSGQEELPFGSLLAMPSAGGHGGRR